MLQALVHSRDGRTRSWMSGRQPVRAAPTSTLKVPVSYSPLSQLMIRYSTDYW